MILTIRNIGPLKEATIDVSRPFTVFTGYNNTGKTIANYILYELFNAGSLQISGTFTPTVDYSNDGGDRIAEVNLYDYFELTRPAFEEAINARLSAIKARYGGQNPEAALSVSFLKDYVRRQLAQVKYFEQYDVIDTINEDLQHWVVTSSSEAESTLIRYTLDNDMAYEASEFETFIANTLPTILYNMLVGRAVFIPAERQGLQVFGREIITCRASRMGDLMNGSFREQQGLQFIQKVKKEGEAYPKAITDGLKLIQETISHPIPDRSVGHTSAQNIETKILKGEIRRSDDGILQYHTPDSPQPIMVSLSSSTVKSLSLLIYYLKTTQKKDFIILDEPELNLHPNNQIQIIRNLLSIVNAGFKLLISTHSEFIIRELNALIQLGSVPNDDTRKQALLDKYGIGTSETIDYRQVAAYFFNEQTANRIDVNATGFDVTAMDDIADELIERSNDIYFTLSD